MIEQEKIGYYSYPLGANYLTIINKENSQSLIIITLIGVEYDIKQQKVSYVFKTASGKFLYRDFGDFYAIDEQRNAELKWKEHCLNKTKELTELEKEK